MSSQQLNTTTSISYMKDNQLLFLWLSVSFPWPYICLWLLIFFYIFIETARGWTMDLYLIFLVPFILANLLSSFLHWFCQCISSVIQTEYVTIDTNLISTQILMASDCSCRIGLMTRCQTVSLPWIWLIVSYMRWQLVKSVCVWTIDVLIWHSNHMLNDDTDSSGFPMG